MLISVFIYKTVPHITLELIANNQAIDPIYNRLYPGIVDTFKELSSVLRQSKIKIQISRGPRDGEVVEIKRDTDFFEWEVPTNFPKIGQKVRVRRSINFGNGKSKCKSKLIQ